MENNSNKMPMIIGLVVLLIVAGAGYWYYTNNMQTTTPADTMTPTTMDSDSDGPQAMTAASPSAASDSATSGEATMADGVQTITVDGGNFYFKPNQIKVKKGTPVKITFSNVQGFHDFMAPDLDVKTNQITAGNKAEVEFTPSKTGTFEFHCSVGNHAAMGMKGTIVVE